MARGATYSNFQDALAAKQSAEEKSKAPTPAPANPESVDFDEDDLPDDFIVLLETRDGGFIPGRMKATKLPDGKQNITFHQQYETLFDNYHAAGDAAIDWAEKVKVPYEVFEDPQYLDYFNSMPEHGFYDPQTGNVIPVPEPENLKADEGEPQDTVESVSKFADAVEKAQATPDVVESAPTAENVTPAVAPEPTPAVMPTAVDDEETVARKAASIAKGLETRERNRLAKIEEKKRADEAAAAKRKRDAEKNAARLAKRQQRRDNNQKTNAKVPAGTSFKVEENKPDLPVAQSETKATVDTPSVELHPDIEAEDNFAAATFEGGAPELIEFTFHPHQQEVLETVEPDEIRTLEIPTEYSMGSTADPTEYRPYPVYNVDSRYAEVYADQQNKLLPAAFASKPEQLISNTYHDMLTGPLAEIIKYFPDDATDDIERLRQFDKQALETLLGHLRASLGDDLTPEGHVRAINALYLARLNDPIVKQSLKQVDMQSHKYSMLVSELQRVVKSDIVFGALSNAELLQTSRDAIASLSVLKSAIMTLEEPLTYFLDLKKLEASTVPLEMPTSLAELLNILRHTAAHLYTSASQRKSVDTSVAQVNKQLVDMRARMENALDERDRARAEVSEQIVYFKDNPIYIYNLDQIKFLGLRNPEQMKQGRIRTSDLVWVSDLESALEFKANSERNAEEGALRFLDKLTEQSSKWRRKGETTSLEIVGTPLNRVRLAHNVVHTPARNS